MRRAKAEHPRGHIPASRRAGSGAAVAAALAWLVASLAAPAAAEVSPNVTQGLQADSDTKRVADAAVHAVNTCDRIRANALIARLRSKKEIFDSEPNPTTNIVSWRTDLAAIIRILEIDLALHCGPHTVSVFEGTATGRNDVSYAFFDQGSQTVASQQWDTLVAAGNRCNEEEFVQAVKTAVDNLRRRARDVEDPQRPSALTETQRAADTKTLRRLADMINQNASLLFYELCTDPLVRRPRFGLDTRRGTGPGPSTSPPGQVPGAPIQTRPVNYVFGDPNAPSGYKLEITGGAHWHEVRKLLYGTVITQPGVPGTEKAFLRSDESISGGALGLKVSAPGRAFGLSDEWRAIARLSGEWASGRAHATAEPGTIDTARRYFVPAANGSTGVNYGGTGMFSSIETDFHRFGLDLMLGRRLGGFQVNGGRVDFGAAFGAVYQYTHIGHDVWENNLTFPDIGSMAGFYTTDHVFGPQIGGRVAYTHGPVRVSAKAQFAPTLVVGSGFATQTNFCPTLCPAAEQNFAQTASGSRTAFNARVTFGVDAAYRPFPGLTVGAYANLTYNSNASAWKFSPNPLKGPPALVGSDDLGIAAGVRVTIALR